jgi:DNA-binding NtrC family response regulator
MLNSVGRRLRRNVVAAARNSRMASDILLPAARFPRMTKTILSISHDHILLETRGAILRKTGHRVISVSSLEDFVTSLRESEIDLVILGHSVPAAEREQAYRLLQEHDCQCPVIELYATAAPPKSPAHFHLAVHDRTFQSDLLALVQQVLSSTPN